MSKPQELRSADYAMMLIEYGLRVFPLKAGSKTPLVPWTEFQGRESTDQDVQDWVSRFGTRFDLGMPVGECTGIIVVDSDSDEASAWCEAHLPPTPVMVRTGRGWHRWYRATGPVASGKPRKDIDLKADGGLVRVPPSGGLDWVLANGSLDDSLAGIPDFDPAWFGGGVIIDMAARKARPRLSDLTLATTGGRNTALASVAGKLARVADDWEDFVIAVGAVNRGYPEPLDDQEVLTTCRSVWGLEQARAVEAAAPAVEVEVYRDDDPGEFPTHLMDVGGVLGEMVDYVRVSARYHHPVMAFGAALATLGGVLGRKVEWQGARTNLYVMTCAPSGVGKDAPMRAMSRLLAWAKLDIQGPDFFTSPAAVLTELQRRPVFVSYLDEVGHALTKAKGAMQNQAGTMPMLTKIWGLASDKVLGQGRASAEDKPQVIEQPHVCLYGTSVIDTVLAALTPSEIADGFLPRWITWVLDVDKRRNPDFIPGFAPSPALVAKVRELAAINAVVVVPGDVAATGVSIGSEGASGHVICNTRANVLEATDEAVAAIQAFEDECDGVYNRLRNLAPDEGAMWNRACEHATKLSAIRAVSDAGGLALVERRHVDWAIELVRYTVAAAVRDMVRRVVVNDYDRECDRVLAAIRRAGPEGVTDGRLKAQIKGLKPNDFKDVLATLRERGAVVYAEPSVAGKRGPKAGLRWIAADAWQKGGDVVD